MPITYEWEKSSLSEEHKESLKNNLKTNIDLTPYKYEGEKYWKIAIKLNDEVDIEHDGAMAYNLGLEYQEYVNITTKYGAELYEYGIEYDVDDIHYTTDSLFKNKEDALKAIKEIQEYREEKRRVL